MDVSDAIECAISTIGSQSELARALGIRPQAVQKWVRLGRVPADRVLAVEDATGGKVTRFDLRPDVFGPPPREAASA